MKCTSPLNKEKKMGFLVNNWEHILATLGALSILFNALEAGCHATGWTKYEGLFTQIANFIKGFLGGVKPPTAGQAGALACIIVALMASNAKADVLPTLPGAKSGIIYDFKTNQVLATNTIKLASVKFVDINGGALRTDGLALTASVDISTLKISWLQLPVIDLFNYINLGYGVGVEDISSDKHYVNGPYASISWKF